MPIERNMCIIWDKYIFGPNIFLKYIFDPNKSLSFFVRLKRHALPPNPYTIVMEKLQDHQLFHSISLSLTLGYIRHGHGHEVVVADLYHSVHICIACAKVIRQILQQHARLDEVVQSEVVATVDVVLHHNKAGKLWGDSVTHLVQGWETDRTGITIWTARPWQKNKFSLICKQGGKIDTQDL